MLTALSIRNVVLIDRLDLGFSAGLSVLTGETGAGKSILLDALGLALGARGDSGLVRHGADQATVSGSFEAPADHPAHALLAEHGLESEGGLVLRRILTADGRSRAFVNDQPVSVTMLRQIGDRLVEVQGQFEQRGLMDPATHRAVLDAFGRLETEAAAVDAAFRAWRTAAEAQRRAEAEAAQAKRDEAFLRHAAEELDGLAPRVGEEQELAETRTVLMHAEKLVAAVNAAFAELGEEGGAETRLRAALRTLDQAADKAGGRLDAARAALERAVVETQDAVRELQAAASAVELDSGGLEQVEERLFALREVARKHSVAVDALPQLLEDISSRLALLDDQSEGIAKRAAATDAARRDYVAKAEKLSIGRAKAATRLDAAVMRELPPLKLEKAHFTTAVERLDERDWGADGMDRVSFLVTTNPGAPPGPLAKIASGGELSRFMLALKVVLAETGTVPTLVFDEVDSGVGGATADAVGERLARLAERLQVLVVTHSPQVAARAADHLRVEKRAVGETVLTGVDRLDAAARREEVARMLSGRAVTDEARAAADRLIHGAPA